MRVLLVFACLFLLTGCGSGFSGPTTNIQEMGVQATLPGTDWQQASSKPTDLDQSDIYINSDGTLAFGISNAPMAQVYVPAFVFASSGSTPEPTKYPSASTSSSILYRNYRITRLESVSPHESIYHMVQYVFNTDNGGKLYVGVGTTNSRWNKDGKDIVADILDGVKVKLVPDISDK